MHKLLEVNINNDPVFSNIVLCIPSQFQSFSQYRCKTAKKSDEEIDFLRSNPKIWNVHSVLNVLHSLVDKSNINRQLEVYTSGGKKESKVYVKERKEVVPGCGVKAHEKPCIHHNVLVSMIKERQHINRLNNKTKPYSLSSCLIGNL